MDILKPHLVYIDGRCYRINNTDFELGTEKPSGSSWDEQNDLYDDDTQLVECPIEVDFEIMTTENGRFKTIFHVSRAYYAAVIGAKGATLKRIEGETKTKIRIPQRQSTDQDVVITGSTKSAVASARQRISLIVMSYRRKQPFTHFLSLPIASKSVKDGFLDFKKQVLETCQGRGVEESIFQNPDKLHLTIGTLVLTDNVERNRASDVLMDCKHNLIDPLLNHNSLNICLEGIEYMNDDPSEVDVLYAKISVQQGDHFLQELMDSIVNFFSDSGLMDKQYERVKLHVTIMNTLFRESNSRTRETFNASPILEKFRNFFFGEAIIDEVHLSQRYSSSKTGYYQATAIVTISLSDRR
uniref:K Homology domain-containing protein n=1 Tax=Clastoptera arizonana TaxID=38151 RepID=A0A1B6DI35_9HEMI